MYDLSVFPIYHVIFVLYCFQIRILQSASSVIFDRDKRLGGV